MTSPRTPRLLARAGEFSAVALRVVRQEFPNDIRSTMRFPGDFPNRPADLYPAFYGCLDWHSCVEMHWLLVRLLRTVPDAVPAGEIRAVLDQHLSGEALEAEAKTFRTTPSRARPYAWGWALTLHHELATWDDPDARRWSANLVPLSAAVTDAFLSWLPKQTYPVRYGAHSNSAFGLSRALPYARDSAGSGALLAAIEDAARRWFSTDTDYPGRWEPSGADFLSPALAEAELQAALLPPGRFRSWLDRFLPGLAGGEPATLFAPATVSDDSDGQLAHLRGLNLSRAWCWLRLADHLPQDDPRVPLMRAAAEQHAEPELDQVSGGHYSVEHWLACYAVLYLTA
ncbi:DUF2891 domain-containing protein [Amycolatopsis sp. PS_44_ISF1]|uniref:DUF2891 domain-containing protein n=1 Tax=Amycolatopsis sp. PS_44_ISF1 TaxID=2974917 RepID=UPI0028E02BF3|nr:DUF2891 domain-containing protein [Amycolatopsis sp. PS_44_ISF1]MDT8913210.1 DUF2891 domain-containing protein [Amycolatopsis sp. PS_44_ISF1]MDT8916257.1 DUF2891 domain-containing protein [Amycolatopsis sp. PS_44_ISF1]